MNKEILWNIINSLLAGGLVFLGGCSSGNITSETFLYAGIAGLTSAVVQFRTFWLKTEPTVKLFKFL